MRWHLSLKWSLWLSIVQLGCLPWSLLGLFCGDGPSHKMGDISALDFATSLNKYKGNSVLSRPHPCQIIAPLWTIMYKTTTPMLQQTLLSSYWGSTWYHSLCGATLKTWFQLPVSSKSMASYHGYTDCQAWSGLLYWICRIVLVLYSLSWSRTIR